jgi:predicted HTH transcriptional regulator
MSERFPCGIQEEYLRKLLTLSDGGARKDLNELVEKNILDSRGKGRNTHYVLKRVGD